MQPYTQVLCVVPRKLSIIDFIGRLHLFHFRLPVSKLFPRGVTLSRVGLLGGPLATSRLVHAHVYVGHRRPRSFTTMTAVVFVLVRRVMFHAFFTVSRNKRSAKICECQRLSLFLHTSYLPISELQFYVIYRCWQQITDQPTLSNVLFKNGQIALF